MQPLHALRAQAHELGARADRADAGERDRQLGDDARGLCGQDEDAVTEEDGLLEVVRDEDDGAPPVPPDVQHLALHALAGGLVEADERLVHEDEIGVGGEGTRDGHALLHAAGDLVRIVALEAGQPDDLDDLAHLRVDRRPCARP